MKDENKNLLEPDNQGFVEQDTALESMRASDFDCYSAYGEVIDNSIQALATDIRIEISEKADRGSSKQIGQIVFCDNGTGMDINLLHKCLKLGHSSRYNDRSGIGRFGVGMTLGAIHECRRVEVYSKIKQGAWNYTYLDLDEIKDKKLKYLPVPVSKTPEFDVSKYIEECGTVVVWRKYDKQVYKYEDIIQETKFWVGRTFRKFIWGEAKGYEGVKISLNGKEINAFDPLFFTKKNTGFENEPKSKLLEPQTLDWTIPLNENSQKQKSKITLNVSLLPDEYRRERLKGGDSFATARNIHRNEGVSILRNDREVFYGHIPYGFTFKEADRNKLRFVGCEIAFDAELDNEFSVKHIKRGAVPIRELKKTIIEKLKPTFRTLIDDITDRWNEKERENEDSVSNDNEKIGVSNKHSKTNELLKANKKGLLKNDKAGNIENNNKIATKVNPKASASELSKIIEGLNENGITIDEREFIGDSFIDIEHGNGFKTMFYNTNSTFYSAYKEILEEIKSKNQEVATDYKILMDLIFVGYMLAESKIDPDEMIDGASFTNEIKNYWSINLSKILKKWKS